MAYTQKFETISTVGSGWQSRDLSGTPWNVPANAVVELVMGNDQTGTSQIVGCRPYGSALARNLTIHEAEGGGVNWIRMHCTVDSQSRLEIYATGGATEIRLLGYWDTGTYVEITPAAYDPSTDGVWGTVTVSEIDADSVCEVVMANEQRNTENEVGCRQVGSSLLRIFDLHESEPSDNSCLTLFVKSNGSKQIQLYSEDVSDTSFHVVGYWSTAPGTWTEKFYQIYWNSSASVWEDEDLSAEMTDGAVGEFAVNNRQTAANHWAGVRKNGTTDDRRVFIDEAEGGGMNFASFHAQSDASGIIETYHSDTVGRTYLTGQWVMAAGQIVPLAGNTAGQGGASGAIKLLMEFLGSCAGQAGTTVNLGVAFSVLGTTGGVSNTPTTGLKLTREIIGSLTGTSGTDGILALFKLLAGSLAGQSGADGAVKLMMKMSGSSGGTGGASAPLKVTMKVLGDSSGSSSASGVVKLTMKVVGSSDAQSSASGIAKVLRELIGSLAGQSSLSGIAKTIRKILGSSAGQSSATGTLTISGEILLQGTTAGQSGADAAVKLTMKIVGGVAGASGTSSVLKLTRTIAGTSDAQSVASGLAKVIRGIVGSASAQSGVVGDVKVEWGLAGTVDAQSGASATPKVTFKISGSADAVSSLIGDLTVAVVTIGRTEAEITLTITTNVALDKTIGTTVAMDRSITRTKEFEVEI